VAQLVEKLRYKTEGGRFDFRCGHWINLTLLAALWAWVRLNSSRNKYQEYLPGRKGCRCVGLTTLLPSCANCLEILGASNSCNPKGLSTSVNGLLFISVKIGDGMKLIHVRKKVSHMDSIERFDIDKGTTGNKQWIRYFIW